MTHDELVDRAGRWLLNTKRCKLVILEPQPMTCYEHPDAIGWFPDGSSILVECKISNADWAAERRKRWRRVSVGMGFCRYFLLGEKVEGAEFYSGPCGVLQMKGKRIVRVVKEAEPRQARAWDEELSLLVSRLSSGRRIMSSKIQEATP